MAETDSNGSGEILKYPLFPAEQHCFSSTILPRTATVTMISPKWILIVGMLLFCKSSSAVPTDGDTDIIRAEYNPRLGTVELFHSPVVGKREPYDYNPPRCNPQGMLSSRIAPLNFNSADN